MEFDSFGGLFAPILFGFITSVKAADKYELKEIKLTSTEVEIPKDFYWEFVKLNKNKTGFTAVGISYKCQQKDCNVYNISMDGVVTKANLRYDDDTDYEDDFIYNYYDYIDVDDNHQLVRYSKVNPGYYDPNEDAGLIEGIQQKSEVLSSGEDIIYEEVYCDGLNGSDVPLRGMVGDRICLIIAKDSDENDLYGLVKEGPNPRVIVAPSKNYSVVDYDSGDYTGFVRSDVLDKGNGNYLFAYEDGTIQEVSTSYFESAPFSNIHVLGNSKDGIVFGIFAEGASETFIGTKELLIGNFDGAYVISLQNGEFFIAEGLDEEHCLAREDCTDDEVKLYNSEGEKITDYTRTQNIGDNVPVISYTKNDKVYFTNGKETLYSVDNPNNKYEWLFSFIAEDNGTYYFKAGTNKVGESNNCLYILSKVKEDVKEETNQEPAKQETKEEKYEVLDGNNQTYDTKGKDALKFRFSIPFADFKAGGKVYLDGKIVDAKNYEASEGSTIITFNKEFSKELKDGKHTVTVETSLGSVTANFTSIGNPKTLDNAFHMIGLLIASLGGVYIVCCRIRKTSEVNE